MNYKELYNNLRTYSKEDVFILLGVELEYYLFYTKEEYVYGFTHKGTHYLILENYDSMLNDKILIDLNNEAKKLIRKRKITNILTQEINI